MKKYLSLIVAFVCGLFAFASLPFSHAFATAENRYLITQNYNQEANYQTKYNILANEVLTRTRPFDQDTTDHMMPGASISPTANDTIHNFNKILDTNAVEIGANDSIFVYLFFTQTVTHDLKISVFDYSSNSLSWNLSSQFIKSQIITNDDLRSVRYGWVLLELPASAAQKTGTLTSILHLEIDYDSSTISSSENYASIYFYAPYVNSSSSEQIKFSNKINYFNYGVKFQNLNYVGESLCYTGLSSLFDYCFLGDVDYLEYDISTYYFKISITNLETNQTTSVTLSSRTVNFNFTADVEASYEMSVTLFDQEDEIVWIEQNDFSVREFVALYVQNGLADMKVGQTFDYEIVLSEHITSYSNLVANSSNQKVVKVSVSEEGKLIVSAVGGGKTTITISMTAQKDGNAAEQYSVEYVAKVVNSTDVNWWLIGGGAILLIVAGIVVYTIMVNRRLIKGKYPKF